LDKLISGSKIWMPGTGKVKIHALDADHFEQILEMARTLVVDHIVEINEMVPCLLFPA